MINPKDERELLSKPGDTILETIEHLRMSQAELADRMGKTSSKINDIISGKEPITVKTAVQLEKVLGIEAQFWLNRETLYREKLLRIEQEEFLQECIGWIKEQPLKELKKAGYISEDKVTTEVAEQVLRFYGVVSPTEWSNLYIEEYAKTAFRKSAAHRSSLSSMAAFLRIGELDMRSIQLPAFDKSGFKNILHDIRKMIRIHPEDYAKQLQDACLACGVGLVYTLSFPGAPISGAVRWVGGNPLIQLTDRYKTNDHFWFTFYHEAAHILLHGKKDVFVEEFEGAKMDNEKEEEANRFSDDWLLPAEHIKDVPDVIGENDVKRIARQAQIHPGIVVGRLQKLGKVPYHFGANLKMKIHLDHYILNSSKK